MEKVEAITTTDNLFDRAEDLVAKSTNDEAKRTADERRMVEVLSAIHSARERLYALRWNPTMQYGDKKREVLTVARELLSLEAELERVRHEGLKNFEHSLVLEGLALSNVLTEKKESEIDFESQTYLEDLESIAHARENMEESELDQIKMMRVASSEHTKDKSKADKWKYLYGMYGEWKEQTNKSDVASSPMRKIASSEASNDEEVIKLRGQIYALKNKASLTQHDKVLLAELQAKLKAAQYRQ